MENQNIYTTNELLLHWFSKQKNESAHAGQGVLVGAMEEADEVVPGVRPGKFPPKL